MKTLNPTFYYDAGHGWLAVRRRLIHELGIEGKITKYSYQSRGGGVIYLEEDCDAGTFMRAAKEAGLQVEVTEYVDHGNYSRIRNYQRYEERRYAQ